MRKRKLDLTWESSTYYNNPNGHSVGYVKSKRILPIILFQSGRPASCEEELNMKSKNISFDYADKFEEMFPPCVSYDIVDIILGYISSFELLIKRASSLEDVCCVCGQVDKRDKFDVRCNRCLSFFCAYCWISSNFIVDHEARLLSFKVFDDAVAGSDKDSPENRCLSVDYTDCPGCLCGLPYIT
jgi:hypothetical protein